MENTYLEIAIKLVGIQKLAAHLGLTYPAIHKWRSKGLPRTEWSGETRYASQIEKLTKGMVSAEKMLAASRKPLLKKSSRKTLDIGT